MLGDHGLELRRSLPCGARARDRPRSAPRAPRGADRRAGAASIWANGSDANSASAGPRHRPSASRNSPEARSASTFRASATSDSKRSRSSSPGSTTSEIARRPGTRTPSGKSFRKPRDVRLQRRHRRLRRLLAPEIMDQPLTRDDPVRAQQQHGENRPLTLTSQRKRPIARAHLQRAKHSKVHPASCSDTLSHLQAAFQRATARKR